MSDFSFSDARLGPLMDEFLERRRRGEHPSLTEFANRCPELEDQIRELFPAMAVLEGAVPEKRRAGESAGAPVDGEGSPLTQLGDFRILREIGRGGMGVVYEAIQESLGRHVALKVLPWHNRANSTHLDRFRREARIAAALHHSNIAPVFGIGEHDGVYYFAMQHIRGQGLDDVLVELRRLREIERGGDIGAAAAASAVSDASIAMTLIGIAAATPPVALEPEKDPTIEETLSLTDSSMSSAGSDQHYFRRVAEIGTAVADALQYAHQQGVLHRDVKPSNVMLDVHGAVWVTDFGLAKYSTFGSSTGSEPMEGADLTGSGDLIGTIRYMPPERLRGHADERGDIYSLGLTLYELLTLTPAFAAPERAELIRLVSLAQPQSPRRHEPRIPRDLETIVLKAIQPEPEARYQSPGEMADDLRRFLADKPIVARRTPVWERCWRWCRRNPSVASLSALVASLLIVIAVGSAVGVARLNRRHNEAVENLRQATEAQRLEQEANLLAKRRLYQAFLTQAKAGTRSDQPGRRFESLQAIISAAELKGDIQLSEQQLLELRTEMISALALADIRLDAEQPCHGPRSAFSRWGFHPDGGSFARINASGAVEIVDLKTNEVRHLTLGFWDALDPPMLEYSPSGRYLGIAGAQEGANSVSVEVWDLRDGFRLVFACESAVDKWSQPLAFSPDDRRVGVLDGSDVRLVDLDSGETVFRRVVPASSALCCSPDGNAVAVCAGQIVHIYDCRHTDKEITLTQPEPSLSIAWAGNGRYLATAGYDGHAYVWDLLHREKSITTYDQHTGRVLRVRFSPDDRMLMSTSWDATTRIWCPWTGRTLLQTPRQCTSFTPDSRWLGFESAGRYVGRFEVSNNSLCRTLFWSARSDIRHLSFHPHGSLLVSVEADRLVLRDWPSGRVIGSPDTSGEYCFGASFSGDGEWLYAGSTHRLDRWPVRALRGDPEELTRLRETRECTTTAPDIAAKSGGGFIVAKGQKGICTIAHDAFSEDGPLLCDAWHAWFLELSDDGRLAAITGKFFESLLVVETADGSVVFEQTQVEGASWADFSPDAKWLAVPERDSVSLIDTKTWETVQSIGNDEAGFVRVCFSPDSSLLAVPGRKVVRLVRMSDLSTVAVLRNPMQDSHSNDGPETANPIAFSPDGRYLLEGTPHGTAFAWDLSAIRSELGKHGLDWDSPSPAKVSAPGDSVTGGQWYPDLFGRDPGLQQSLAAIGRQIDAAPNDGNAILKRARLLQENGLMEEALADYDRLVSLDAGNASWLYSRASALSEAGRDEQAVRDYRRVLSLESEQSLEPSWACNNLAWLLLTGDSKVRDFKEGLRLARDAVAQSPDDASIRNTLGLALLRNGQVAEARPLFEKNVRTESPEDTIHDQFCLVICYETLGEPIRADSAWEKATELWLRQGPGTPSAMKDIRALCREAAALRHARVATQP